MSGGSGVVAEMDAPAAESVAARHAPRRGRCNAGTNGPGVPNECDNDVVQDMVDDGVRALEKSRERAPFDVLDGVEAIEVLVRVPMTTAEGVGLSGETELLYHRGVVVEQAGTEGALAVIGRAIDSVALRRAAAVTGQPAVAEDVAEDVVEVEGGEGDDDGLPPDVAPLVCEKGREALRSFREIVRETHFGSRDVCLLSLGTYKSECNSPAEVPSQIAQFVAFASGDDGFAQAIRGLFDLARRLDPAARSVDDLS